MRKNNFSCKGIAELDALNEHCIHRKKLLAIKPRIDNKPPKAMSHIHHKAKKELEELKVQANIQYQNQILLKKLQRIEQNSSKSLSSHKLASTQNHLRLDQLMKIGSENQKILTRIQSAKPHYPAEKLKEEYLLNKYLAMKLSENARRYPKTMSYNLIETNPKNSFNFQDICESSGTLRGMKSVRPNTASGSSRNTRKMVRPQSAKHMNLAL